MTVRLILMVSPVITYNCYFYVPFVIVNIKIVIANILKEIEMYLIKKLYHYVIL